MEVVSAWNHGNGNWQWRVELQSLLLTKPYGKRFLEDKQCSRGARTLGSGVGPQVWALAVVRLSVLVGFSKKQTLSASIKCLCGRSSKETPNRRVKKWDRKEKQLIKVHIKQLTTVGNCCWIPLEDSGSQCGTCTLEFSCLMGEEVELLIHQLPQWLVEGCSRVLTPWHFRPPSLLLDTEAFRSSRIAIRQRNADTGSSK